LLIGWKKESKYRAFAEKKIDEISGMFEYLPQKSHRHFA
jgi:hypothetical protein